jgi:hypothetical protein
MRGRDWSKASWVFTVAVTAWAIGPHPALADFTFGEPVNLKSIIPALDPAHDFPGCLSYDGLEMYITSGQGHDNDLRVMRRESKDGEWGPSEDLGPVINVPSPIDDSGPSISAGGLTLYFHSNRLGGHGDYDIYMTIRTARNVPWGPPVNLGPKVNSSSTDVGPRISADGLELYFYSWRPGGCGDADIYVTRRATQNDLWGEPLNLGPVVNSANDDNWPCVSPDGLLLFFLSRRGGGYGGTDIWMTRRVSLSDPWQAPVNLGPKINVSALDDVPRISPDGSTLYFGTGVTADPGTWDNWQAPIIPIVDFNSDGKVDLQDLLRLIESWGKSNLSVDVGPYAWGDGVVDKKDIEVLMGYWDWEVNDPTLIAHWKLDETEGTIVHDSAGEHHDATIMGVPLWQPEGGMIGGALQFSGVPNFAMAKVVRNPSEGALSIFAWVKGGGPGQVAISQQGGANWLMASVPDGMLGTDLKSGGRESGVLTSESVITDGNWHRVGLTWDGETRILYVDDIEVARDTQASLASSTENMTMGAGSTMAPASFWKGLIDDVRIYDRAVKP